MCHFFQQLCVYVFNSHLATFILGYCESCGLKNFFDVLHCNTYEKAFIRYRLETFKNSNQGWNFK